MTIERLDFFRQLAEARTDEIVVTTMTATLQWPLVSKHALDFDFLAFGMGHAADFGMGLALARPERKVVVLMGDGGLLMSLGSLVTIGRYGPANLVVFLLENRMYEMTGGQPFSSKADFLAMAHGAGIDGARRIEEPALLQDEISAILGKPELQFVVVPVVNSHPLPPVAHTDHASRVVSIRAALGLGG